MCEASFWEGQVMKVNVRAGHTLANGPGSGEYSH